MEAPGSCTQSYELEGVTVQVCTRTTAKERECVQMRPKEVRLSLENWTGSIVVQLTPADVATIAAGTAASAVAAAATGAAARGSSAHSTPALLGQALGFTVGSETAVGTTGDGGSSGSSSSSSSSIHNASTRRVEASSTDKSLFPSSASSSASSSARLSSTTTRRVRPASRRQAEHEGALTKQERTQQDQQNAEEEEPGDSAAGEEHTTAGEEGTNEEASEERESADLAPLLHERGGSADGENRAWLSGASQDSPCAPVAQSQDEAVADGLGSDTSSDEFISDLMVGHNGGLHEGDDDDVFLGEDAAALSQLEGDELASAGLSASSSRPPLSELEQSRDSTSSIGQRQRRGAQTEDMALAKRHKRKSLYESALGSSQDDSVLNRRSSHSVRRKRGRAADTDRRQSTRASSQASSSASSASSSSSSSSSSPSLLLLSCNGQAQHPAPTDENGSLLLKDVADEDDADPSASKSSHSLPTGTPLPNTLVRENEEGGIEFSQAEPGGAMPDTLGAPAGLPSLSSGVTPSAVESPPHQASVEVDATDADGDPGKEHGRDSVRDRALHPAGRWGHTSIMLNGSTMLIYGGEVDQPLPASGGDSGPGSSEVATISATASDMFLFDLETLTWRREEPSYNAASSSSSAATASSAAAAAAAAAAAVPETDTRDPLARTWHTLTLLPEANMAIALGGERIVTTATPAGGSSVSELEQVEEVLVLDTDLLLWYPPTTAGRAPTARSGHSANVVYFPRPGASSSSTTAQRGAVVVFGGCRSSRWSNNADLLDTDEWRWSKLSVTGKQPKPRSFHSGTVLAETIVYFGGNDAEQSFNDVWTLSLSAPTKGRRGKGFNLKGEWNRPQVMGAAPAPRSGHSAVALDDRYIFCYGGWDAGAPTAYFDDSYILDTDLWVWHEGPMCTDWHVMPPRRESAPRTPESSALDDDDEDEFSAAVGATQDEQENPVRVEYGSFGARVGHTCELVPGKIFGKRHPCIVRFGGQVEQEDRLADVSFLPVDEILACLS